MSLFRQSVCGSFGRLSAYGTEQYLSRRQEFVVSAEPPMLVIKFGPRVEPPERVQIRGKAFCLIDPLLSINEPIRSIQS